jgi:hypothetical protein
MNDLTAADPRAELLQLAAGHAADPHPNITRAAAAVCRVHYPPPQAWLGDLDDLLDAARNADGLRHSAAFVDPWTVLGPDYTGRDPDGAALAQCEQAAHDAANRLLAGGAA